MFFNCEDIAAELLDVFEFHHENTHNVGRRDFCSLSLRITADTLITSGNEEYRATDGTLVFFPAQCPYRRVSKNEYMIAVNFKIYNRIFKKIELFQPKNFEDIRTLFEKMVSVSKEKRRGYKYKLIQLFYEILELATKNFDGEERKDNRMREQINRFVCENYKNPDFTVKDLALLMYMSEVTLRKYVRELFGKSPKELIADMRMEYAVSLINSREFKVFEVAEMSGFASEKYFGTLFKRKFGVTPAKYPAHA
ncbi:MAG TPA: hypothetical protein DCE08_00100 [Ruminococcaceae bacterium]|nr:hypothetical protein [Oscillospiraceae bacterium]